MAIPPGKHLLPRHNLPSNYKFSDNQHQKATQKKHRLPKWITDEATYNRTIGIYKDYLACMTLPELHEKYGVSITQIYRDIDNAKQEARYRADDELETLAAQSIETRRGIIHQTQARLEAIRSELLVSPTTAQAEAALLRIISDQQTAIEQIQLVRDRQKGGLAPLEHQLPGMPHPSSAGGVTLIINASGVEVKPPQILDQPMPEDEDDEDE